MSIKLDTKLPSTKTESILLGVEIDCMSLTRIKCIYGCIFQAICDTHTHNNVESVINHCYLYKQKLEHFTVLLKSDISFTKARVH